MSVWWGGGGESLEFTLIFRLLVNIGLCVMEHYFSLETRSYNTLTNTKFDQIMYCFQKTRVMLKEDAQT